jgi:hypothetical protein
VVGSFKVFACGTPRLTAQIDYSERYGAAWRAAGETTGDDGPPKKRARVNKRPDGAELTDPRAQAEAFADAAEAHFNRNDHVAPEGLAGLNTEPNLEPSDLPSSPDDVLLHQARGQRARRRRERQHQGDGRGGAVLPGRARGDSAPRLRRHAARARFALGDAPDLQEGRPGADLQLPRHPLPHGARAPRGAVRLPARARLHVDCPALWAALRHYRANEDLIKVLAALYDGTWTSARWGGRRSRAVPVTWGTQ